MVFLYDATGLYGFRYNGTTYFYLYNGQGDVVGILNNTGAQVVSYTYDAWGKPLTTTGSLASTIGELNPIRYRGYYYDAESGLYSIGSRYYDPELGRFINADIVMGVNDDMATYNLFVYCGNNPINRYDAGGMFWKEVWGLVKGRVRLTLHLYNAAAVWIGIDTAAVGAWFLNMEADDDGVYHANFDCWQQYFGYNDFYDFMFDIGTSMMSAKFQFSYNGTQYMIWAWKGDYINLGAGAELGIYYGGEPHWQVDKSLAMHMNLRLYYKGENIITYYDFQWWITGFNPNYLNTSANDLTAEFTLGFNDYDMYCAFENSVAGDSRWCFITRNSLFAFFTF